MTTGEDGADLWRRFRRFPLVAMVAAVLLFLLAMGLGTTLADQLGGALQPPAVSLVVRNGVVLLATLATYKLAISRLGERRRDDLTGPGALPNLAVGLATGFAIMALAVGAAAVAGVYRIVSPGDSSQLVHELVVSAVMPAFLEELLFRGILFRWIEAFGGSWLALVLTSVFFGGAHLMNPNATVVAAFGIAIEAGVMLGGAYMLTRRLWLPMGIHAGWNFTQGEIFDVPVSGLDEHGLVQATMTGPPLLSGGGFGLEASVFAMGVATAAGIWLVWLAVRRGQLLAPMWVRSAAAAA